MCVTILYTLCGLYATYCVTFCSAMGYTLWKERKERKKKEFNKILEMVRGDIESQNNEIINYSRQNHFVYYNSKLETIYEEKEPII